MPELGKFYTLIIVLRLSEYTQGRP